MNPPATARFAWTVNRRLAAAALALGALAMAGQPARGHRVTLDTRQLAAIVGGEVDHVTPAELAGWIVAGRADYRLIDLRDPAAFERYHVPTAENVPIVELGDHGLLRNEKIVLYSEGGIHSAQAWMLLAAEGYPGVYILRGGLEGWQEEVLFPVAPDGAAPEKAGDFARRVELARHFGGQPRTASAANAALPALGAPATPAPGLTGIAAPAPPPGTTARPPAKKKKEGC